MLGIRVRDDASLTRLNQRKGKEMINLEENEKKRLSDQVQNLTTANQNLVTQNQNLGTANQNLLTQNQNLGTANQNLLTENQNLVTQKQGR